jgi:hypothetical protein
MELFGIILLGIGFVSGAIVFWIELSITNDRIRFLEERLYKLEKDAVKITFSEPYSPQDEEKIEYHGMRTTPKDVDKILNRNDGDQLILNDWQKNFEKRYGGPLFEGNVKSTSKGDTGKTQGPPPKPVKIKKRKPKSVKEWEDEIDLGGHE